MDKFLFALGVLGLLTSSVYCLLAILAALRFSRRRQTGSASGVFAGPVSLLKPLHGDEPGLEGRLESFFLQDYSNYEILFCARHSHDAGLQVARRVAARYPHIPSRFLSIGEPKYWNAKVASLEKMAAAARFDILVISDSDVHVSPEYARSVVQPFQNAEVGLVTCLYRGVASESSLWSRLEAAGMSVEMTSGVLVADMVEGMKFALGPTMAVRKRCVAEIGGFGVLGQYCADDFVLGNSVAANSHQVVLSTHVIDHIVLNSDFLHSIKHQIRWMKSTRFSRPKGHFGTGLTFSVPFGLLTFFAAMALHWREIGTAALGWSVVMRLLLAAIVSVGIVQERNWFRTMLLYPLRDLMGFFYWVLSYFSNKILWRGEVFQLLPEGIMQPVHETVTPSPALPEDATAITHP